MSPQNPIRLLFVLQDLDFGGAQRQALRLASRLNPSKFCVEIVVLRSGGGFVSKAKKMATPICFLSKNKKHVTPFSLLGLWLQLKRKKPDIIVPFTAVPNIWCRIFGRFFRSSLVIGTCRGGGAILRQKEKWLWPWADHHICNAKSLQKMLFEKLNLPAGRVSFIPNGISILDLEQSHTSMPTDAPKEILCVGRLVEDKDHVTLIRAFFLVHKDYPNVRLRIIGDGHLLGRLRHFASSLNILEYIVFQSAKMDIQSEFAKCHIFVLSSSNEASPNVLLEALAAKRPVVATCVGGVPDLILDGKTGLLVKPHSPEEMATAILRLLNNPELQKKLGEAGEKYVKENFSVVNMVAKYEEVFSDVFTSLMKA